MNDPSKPQVDQLLAHGQALRSIARSLLGDGAHVDDIVQESYLATLQGLPPGANLGAWMRGVARKLSFRWVRRETRRRHRETAALERAATTGEQTQILRQIADAVDQLREPFRTAIVMRYWQGLPPRTISRDLGVPINTVRSRLHKGLGELRRVLDRRHTDRAAWVGPLAVFGSQQSAGSGGGGGGIAAVGALAVGGIIAGALALDPDPWLQEAAVSIQVATPMGEAPAAPGVTAVEARQAVVDTSAAIPPVTGQCVAYGSKLPLPACRVRMITVLRGGKRRGEWVDCDEQGRFRLRLRAEDRPSWLEVAGSGRANLRVELGGGGCALGSIQMPCGKPIRGRVCDRAGVPISGIRLRLKRWTQSLLWGDAAYLAPEPWQVFRGSFYSGKTSAKADFHPLQEGYAKTDRDGEFRLGGLWLGRPADDALGMDVANLEEYKLVTLRQHDRGKDLWVEIVMRRPVELPRLAGTLIATDGIPVAGAKIVATSRDWSKVAGVTDAQGRFELIKSLGDDEADHVTLSLPAVVRGGFATIEPQRSFTWGDTAIRLQAVKPVPLTLTTRDADLDLRLCKLSCVVFSGADCALAGHFLAEPTESAVSHRASFRIARLLSHLILVTPDQQQIYLGLHRIDERSEELQVVRHCLQFLVRDQQGEPLWSVGVGLAGDFASDAADRFLDESADRVWRDRQPIRPLSRAGRFAFDIGFSPDKCRVQFSRGAQKVIVRGDGRGAPVIVSMPPRR